MKLLHLADLHIGKSVHEFDLLSDQEYILGEIIRIIDEEMMSKPDAAVISGDVFDRPIPPVEAIRLFERFLGELNSRKIKVYIISGNHDSPERLAYGSSLMKESGVFFARSFADYPSDGYVLEKHVLTDEYGSLNLYLLPFLKPSTARRFFPDAEIRTWTEAVRSMISTAKIDRNERNVIAAHQFVTGSEISDSEYLAVGGAEQIEASVFDGFCYVALGHLHKPQKVRRETIRYAGSPLKYSFSEMNFPKTLPVAEIGRTAEDVAITLFPLIPKREMALLKGTYLQLASRDFYKNIDTSRYFKVILEDREEQPDVLRKLRTIYPNIMLLEYAERRVRRTQSGDFPDASRNTPEELFRLFYREQNGRDLDEKQARYMEQRIAAVFGGDDATD